MTVYCPSDNDPLAVGHFHGTSEIFISLLFVHIRPHGNSAVIHAPNPAVVSLAGTPKSAAKPTPGLGFLKIPNAFGFLPGAPHFKPLGVQRVSMKKSEAQAKRREADGKNVQEGWGKWHDGGCLVWVVSES